ncbi:hypothetical protein [Streptomyces sp. NPDC090445]|uniref:hypothetical protein n=1 Tax=Streptomyces sp. NPDC090445 TaxID=3365963 RepID=UPI003816E8B9
MLGAAAGSVEVLDPEDRRRALRTQIRQFIRRHLADPLDEPASGLDAQAEAEIQEALRTHRRGRTSLLISHRLGSVREADAIVVLEAGQVVEQGGHASLMAADGRYARLFALQASGYRQEDSPAAAARAGAARPAAVREAGHR